MYFVQKMREIKIPGGGVEGNVASIEEKRGRRGRRRREEEKRNETKEDGCDMYQASAGWCSV